MLITEERDDVAVLRTGHGRVGALDVELLNALTGAVTASDQAIEMTADGDAAVLSGWTSHDTRRRIEAALAALARRPVQ